MKYLQKELKQLEEELKQQKSLEVSTVLNTILKKMIMDQMHILEIMEMKKKVFTHRLPQFHWYKMNKVTFTSLQCSTVNV